MQDLTANPKCSLLVARDPEDRTDLVITLHGDAVSVCYNPSQVLLSVLVHSASILICDMRARIFSLVLFKCKDLTFWFYQLYRSLKMIELLFVLHIWQGILMHFG